MSAPSSNTDTKVENQVLKRHGIVEKPKQLTLFDMFNRMKKPTPSTSQSSEVINLSSDEEEHETRSNSRMGNTSSQDSRPMVTHVIQDDFMDFDDPDIMIVDSRSNGQQNKAADPQERTTPLMSPVTGVNYMDSEPLHFDTVSAVPTQLLTSESSHRSVTQTPKTSPVKNLGTQKTPSQPIVLDYSPDIPPESRMDISLSHTPQKVSPKHSSPPKTSPPKPSSPPKSISPMKQFRSISSSPETSRVYRAKTPTPEPREVSSSPEAPAVVHQSSPKRMSPERMSSSSPEPPMPEPKRRRKSPMTITTDDEINTSSRRSSRSSRNQNPYYSGVEIFEAAEHVEQQKKSAFNKSKSALSKLLASMDKKLVRQQRLEIGLATIPESSDSEEELTTPMSALSNADATYVGSRTKTVQVESNKVVAKQLNKMNNDVYNIVRRQDESLLIRQYPRIVNLDDLEPFNNPVPLPSNASEMAKVLLCQGALKLDKNVGQDMIGWIFKHLLSGEATPLEIVQSKTALQGRRISLELFEIVVQLGVRRDIFDACFRDNWETESFAHLLSQQIEEWSRVEHDLHKTDTQGFGFEFPDIMKRFERLSWALKLFGNQIQDNDLLLRYLAFVFLLSLDRRMGGLYRLALDECTIMASTKLEDWKTDFTKLAKFIDKIIPREAHDWQVRLLQGPLMTNPRLHQLATRLARHWIGFGWSQEMWHDFCMDCGEDETLPSWNEVVKPLKHQLDFSQPSKLEDIVGTVELALQMQKLAKKRRENSMEKVWKDTPRHVRTEEYTHYVHFVDLNPSLHPIPHDADYSEIYPLIGIIHFAFGGVEGVRQDKGLTEHVRQRLLDMHGSIRDVSGMHQQKTATKLSIFIIQMWLQAAMGPTHSFLVQSKLNFAAESKDEDEELAELALPRLPDESRANSPSVHHDSSEWDEGEVSD